MKTLMFALSSLNEAPCPEYTNIVLGMLRQSSIEPWQSKGLYRLNWIVRVKTIDQERLIRAIAGHFGQQVHELG